MWFIRFTQFWIAGNIFVKLTTGGKPFAWIFNWNIYVRNLNLIGFNRSYYMVDVIE